jgi:hypothetical protein
MATKPTATIKATITTAPATISAGLNPALAGAAGAA